MAEAVYCNYPYKYGKKKGTVCGKLCRSEGPMCHEHTRNKGRVKPKCPHGRYNAICVDCKGSSICPHGNRKQRCVDCGGASICPHKMDKYKCKTCHGTGICEHDREKYACTLCANSTGVCVHKSVKHQCKICDPHGHLIHRVRYHTWRALKGDKADTAMQYLGCDIDDFKMHIESQFKPGMSWENYGEKWHIDHIIPLKYGNPTTEELMERLDFTNCQPMWAEENIAKGNKWVG